MQIKSIVSALALSLIGALTAAQTPTPDQLNALKNLPQDQQNSLLQGVLGKSDGKKTDPKLNMPDTVQSKNGQSTDSERLPKKTSDGRTLRVLDEDPELRADDTVLIDLTPLETRKGNGPNTGADVNGMNANNGINGLNGINGSIGNIGNTANNNNNNASTNNVDNNNRGNTGTDFGRIQVERKPKSDEEIKKLEEHRDQILKSNPYKLNRFG